MEMEKNKKILFAVVGVATLGLVFLLYKTASAKSNSGTTLLNKQTDVPKVQPTQEQQVPDIADMPGEPNATPGVDLIGLVQAPKMADLSNYLYDAFNGLGTTWENGQFGGVYGVFSQLKSDDDFDELTNLYGIRKVKSGLIFRKDYTGDLNSTMNDELTKREINLINSLLESNGLTRRITINQ